MITVSRTVRFCAAHRLCNPAWSPAENRRVYGRCSNPGGHGHNYTLTVTVCGPHDPATGMVVNVSALGAVLEREVVAHLDHRDLNHDVDFLAGTITTMENLAAILAARLGPPLAALGVKLTALELAESDYNRVTFHPYD
jgi:6-pyruvoyltetrahydropterin/6-carboxytetrahydropterin synthase